jgi:tryptophan synthase beta chain
MKRANYVSVTDDEALDAFRRMTLVEGIMPALETSHGIAYGLKKAATMKSDQIMIINLSGRGDKDIHTVANIDGISI